MDEWIGLTASTVGGGVFGLVGSAMGRVAAYVERRQEGEAARAQWRDQLAPRAETVRPAPCRVEAARALTRPALTLLLWLTVGAIYLGADAAGRAAIIDTATFAATAATLWWFGDRGPRRA